MIKFFRKNRNIDRRSIKDVVLAITYKCNSRCRFCNIWKNDNHFSCNPICYNKLPQTTKNVNLTGGEPFLRDDLLEIIKIISRRASKSKIVISTNGFLPSKIKQTMQKIIKFRKDIGIAVSLDGFGKAHEELRRFPGGFCLAVETIRLLKELRIKNIKIAFTLGDNNIDQLKKVYQLSKELGVEFSLAVYHNSSHYFQTRKNQINNIGKIEKELNWLIEQELKSFSLKKWIRAYFAYGMIKFLETKKRILPDYSGINSLFIDPFGKIYPSNVWNLEIGRLQKVKDWNKFSKKAKKLILNNKGPNSWMACTARQAMKKHWLEIIKWIIRKKFLLFIKSKKYKSKYSEKQLSLFLKRVASIF